jgi:hypothetical protein
VVELQLIANSGAGGLSSAVTTYLRAATPENTHRAYESDLYHFLSWGGAIPATDVMIAEYLAQHAGLPRLQYPVLCSRRSWA